MKTKFQLLAFALLFSTLNSPLSTCLAQGSLTPPGAPAPTMKSLDQIEPRTPILSVPYTISAPGAYYLLTNVVSSGGNSKGVIISSGNVTVDLNGFAMIGTASSGEAVYFTGGFTNVTVRNGIITGWGAGGVSANAGSPRNVVLERLMISGNAGFGVLLQGSSVVRDCVSQNNGTGIASYGGLISSCIARDNSFGIIAYGNCLVRDCEVSSNSSAGIALFDTGTVSGCTVMNNPAAGIMVQANGCQIIGNTLYSNRSGIFLNGGYNRIDNNQVISNTLTGIQGNGAAVTTNNVIVRNTVAGTGVNNFATLDGNDVGPIGSASTNTSPWANISH
jgi:parallel beta-helix repeat protein